MLIPFFSPRGTKISICFLDNILIYMHLFVSYYEYHKMVQNITSVEYNLDENSDSEGNKNEDIGDNESIVPDFDHSSSDIEVSSVGSSEVSSDNTDFGEELDDNGLTLLMILLSLLMQTFLTGQLTSLT